MFKKPVSRIAKGLLAGALAFSCITTTVSIENVSAAEKEEDYTQYVDPFVSTDVDYGQLFPGPVVPNGLVKLCADTYPHDTLDHAGYDYSKTQISGFSHTRIEGVGGQGAGGDVLVTPTYVQYDARPAKETRAMKYAKEDEFAKPGFYSVELVPNTGTNKSYQSAPELGKIKAKMTTDQRTGFHSYTFPKAGNVNILTDLNYCYHGTDIRNATLDVLEQNDKTTAIGGRFSGKNVGGSGKYTMYFYMETSKPANNVKTWNGQNLTDYSSQKGNDIGAIMNFDVKDNEEIKVKVSISPISVKQAKRDMNNEIPHWDFDQVREDAKQQWNDVLSKVRIETSKQSDPTGELKQLFYTHLYHMFMTPMNATSTEGTFRGTDGNIHEAKDYTHYDSWTLWDDYRKYPMIGLIQPDVYKDMVRSIANALDYGIVTWSHDKQPVPNVRTEHAVALLADGVAKGFTDIENLEEAYREAIKIANKVVKDDQDFVPGRMDQTVEYAYDDWALSLIADALGHEEEAQYFLNRSFNYKNLYKPNADREVINGKEQQFGLLISRNADGSWKNVDPRSYGGGLYQGTHWQYSWYLSNDVNGMTDLMGGKQKLFEALSMLFGEHNDGRTTMHNAANEVELHAPYLFNFAGRPDRTQYWVRQIYTKESYNDNYTGSSGAPQKMYKLSPQGYLHTMDDDAGTMAMMFVSAAMGIFPMTPGDTTFQIGTPFFEKMTLDVGNGKTFTIEANNVSADNYYIQSAKLNGVDFNRTWIDYSEITRGGVLSFEMGDKPSTWAQNGVPASSASDNADTSTYDDDEIAYSTAMLEEAEANDGSFTQKIEMTLKTKQFTGNIGDDLVANGAIKVSNVPEGLSASAIKTADNKVQIALNGHAKKHKLNDSIGNLTIEVTDAATNEVIEGSIRKVKDNVKVMFSDDKLTYSTTVFKEATADDGSIADTATVTLSGSSTFTGEVNEDFVETGKMALTNIPEGLTVKAVKTGERTLVLSFEGKAKAHAYDVEFETTFNDNAFNGAKASEVENSSNGGMTALLLDFSLDITSRLQKAVAEAKVIKEGIYTKTTYENLQTVIAECEELLKRDDLTEKEILDACTKIEEALNNLNIVSSALKRLEAERSDDWSDNGLKNETINLGGTYDGAWVKYSGLDFTNTNIKAVEVRYDNNSGRCAADSYLELRADSLDGELLGKVQMPKTGSSWGNYKTTQVDLDKTMEGVHDIYVVLHGTTGTNPYIANIDYFQFVESIQPEEITKVRLEAEKSNEWSANGLKNESINLGGTYDGAWIKYNKVDFKDLNANTINVRYATRVDKCALDARIEVRKGNKDGELLGTVMLPLTTGWGDYQTVTVDLSNVLNGETDVCFVLRGTTSSERPYIANVDYMEFEYISKKTHIEAEDKNDWSAAELKVENSKDSAGKDLVNVGGSRNNAWLRYNGINFSSARDTEFTVRYSHNPGSAGTNSRIDIYLDNMDGEPVGTIDLPTTNGWANYTIISNVLKERVNGTHDVFLKLHTDGGKWVANFDWIEFDHVNDTVIVDKSELQKVYNEYKDLLTKGNLYQEIGFNIFKGTMVEAQLILDNKDATELEVTIAINDILNAVKTLQFNIEFDLASLIAEIEALDESVYTKDSYEVLSDAMKAAKEIADGSDYNTYKEAYDALVDAKAKLTVLNRNILRSTVERAQGLELGLYTEESLKAFNEALEAAVKVLEEKSLTQKEVDDAATALDEAIEALVLKKADYSKVNEAIAKADAIDRTKYTEESLAKLDEAVKAVERDLDITEQDKVDAMAKAIEDALKGLVESIPWTDLEPSTPVDPTKPVDPEKPENGGETDKEEGTDTGDTTNKAAMAGLMLLAGAVIVSRKRKTAK